MGNQSADTDTLGDVLRTARVRKRYLQSEAAAHVGISQPTISAWENNTGRPSFATLVKLARFYQLPVNDLLRYIEQ